MLCSNCSQPVQPIVAVDIDGVLGDYHGHFLRFAANWTGAELKGLLTASLDGYHGDEPFGRYCSRIFGITIDQYRECKLAYRQGGQKRSMPVFPGATHLCASIKDTGAELWMTTTRPYLSLDNIVPDTVEWLERHNIEYDHMLFDLDKYEQLAKRVDDKRVVAVLDDLPEMCLAAERLYFGRDVPILVNNPFNKKAQYPLRADLDICLDIVLGRIEYWREQYAA